MFPLISYYIALHDAVARFDTYSLRITFVYDFICTFKLIIGLVIESDNF